MFDLFLDMSDSDHFDVNRNDSHVLQCDFSFEVCDYDMLVYCLHAFGAQLFTMCSDFWICLGNVLS